MSDQLTFDAADYCDARCPHCGEMLVARRYHLGTLVLCQNTGKDFVLLEFKRESLSNKSVSLVADAGGHVG